MADIDLDFLARQMERLLTEMQGMREEMAKHIELVVALARRAESFAALLLGPHADSKHVTASALIRCAHQRRYDWSVSSEGLVRGDPNA